MRGRYVVRNKKTYAIYGMGSTRLAIALANYYSSYLKKRVAVGEVGEGNMSDMRLDCRSDNTLADTKLVGFTRMKVDYYPYIDMESVMKLNSEEYDAIIWDFRDISHDYMNLYRLCERRFFLCNIASYNRRSFCEVKNLLESDMVEVEIYCYLLSKQDRRWYDATIGRRQGFDISDMRLICNPDKLSREDIAFLERTAAG